MSTNDQSLRNTFSAGVERLDQVIDAHRVTMQPRELGMVLQAGRGIAQVRGLRTAENEELLEFPGRHLGFVFNLDPEVLGCVLLDQATSISAGDEVRRTYRRLDVPVGPELLGRIIDPVGRPLDDRGELGRLPRAPVEQAARPIMDRAPVSRPLQTGIKVIDALVPIGRGQRQLIVGDRQTGKTSIAVNTMINQLDAGVRCVFCAIGQRTSAVTSVIQALRSHGAMENCVVVVADPDATAGLQFVAPYAATSIAEYFMEQGQDALIVYDDLTAHARAYREMSLLLRRPPGREAFPGDIFFVHARLLERATSLRQEAGGGSITALPLVETEAQNVSAYVPTNLISITDGQVYLSPQRFRKGILPAVDVGRSVSRVGGKAQLPAYRSVTGPLRLGYSQFEELEKFARFSSQLDVATRKTLRRGERVRQLLQQGKLERFSVVEQVISFLAIANGLYDAIDTNQIHTIESNLTRSVIERLPQVADAINQGIALSDGAIDQILSIAHEILNEESEQR